MRRFLLTTTLITLAGAASAQTIGPGSGSITDPAGHHWIISASGSIQEDGAWTPGGGGTSALTIINGTVYGQDNGHDGNTVNSGGWFALSNDGQSWQMSPPPSAVPAAVAVPPSAAPATASPAAPAAATAAVAPAVSVCGSGVPSGAFKVVNGQIIGPDGKSWVARGLAAHDYNLASAADKILTAYPGTNIIRVASYMTMGPADFAGVVSQLTSKGIVVEFSDYTNTTGQDWGGGQGEIFTGATLANESAWYASMAKYFASNPYVWFGTDNEPAEGQGLSAWHQATYNAIRGTGNANPILIDPAGWNPDSMQINAVQSIYGQMTNIIWDPHIYSNSGNPTGSADAATTWAKGTLAQTQTVQSADGVVPMIVGEYGVGSGPDPIDMVVAVINAATSGLSSGAAAWAWDTSPPNVLSDTGSQYSQMVALYINTSIQACSATETAANAKAAIVAVQNQANPTAAPTTAPAAGIVETPDTTASTPPPALTDPATVAAISQADTLLAGVRALTGATQ